MKKLVLLAFLLLTACEDDSRLYRVEDAGGEPHAVYILPEAGVPDEGLPSTNDAFVDGDIPEASVPDAGWMPVQTSTGPYDLRITLHWDYGMPGRSTDVDLHLLHPDATQWFNHPLDCYYGNTHPLWDGTSSTSPRLDHDITTGYGPETITLQKGIERPNPYRVGVHYFSDHGMGPSTVYVQIECGSLVVQMGPQVLEDEQLWRLADLAFYNGSCVFVPVDIITNYGEPGYSNR
jgi:hypothetical protein